MSEESSRFRLRAIQCRELAKMARHETERTTLSKMAEELDEEAARIETEEARDQGLI